MKLLRRTTNNSPKYAYTLVFRQIVDYTDQERTEESVVKNINFQGEISTLELMGIILNSDNRVLLQETIDCWKSDFFGENLLKCCH
ncbi:hypothetical protein NIES4101_39850 [Calothrix sp. NIES-4101]|nr:hypothetical protein NIES4101_39850 [Calothrix sp. NIES-4101]